VFQFVRVDDLTKLERLVKETSILPGTHFILVESVPSRHRKAF